MILCEGDTRSAETLSAGAGAPVVQLELAIDGDPTALAKERLDWLCDRDDDDVVLHGPMLRPLVRHFFERSVLEMMLCVRGACAPEPSAGCLLPPLPQVPEARAYRAAFPSMPGIGSLHPHTVFVGEQPNPRTLGYTRGVPFSVGPSGSWLMTSLGCIDLRSSSYITNAIKHDGDSRMVAREIRWLQPSSVVALGTVASEVLSKAKIAHTIAWHPQYARRFHFKEQHEYVEQIRQAVHLGSSDRYRYA